MQRLVFFTLLSLIWVSAHAREFHIDPQAGNAGGDGSAAQPWRTLQAVIEGNRIETQHWSQLPYRAGAQLQAVNPGAPVQPGDTVLLHSGYHGDILIQGAYNAQMITVAAAPGEQPTLGKLHVRGGSNWTFRGLSISPSHAPNFARQTIVFLENHAHQGPTSDIFLEGNQLFSVTDTSGWSAGDWVQRSCDGVLAHGDRITLRNNYLLNVRFAIETRGSEVLVTENTIENFSGDGIRGLGNNSVYEYNLVKNSYDVDENHDDGFQSYSRGPNGQGSGEVRNVIVRGNIFIDYEDPNQRHRGPMQGIGCFDGFFVDWVVENNLVIANHWHGITLLGARNTQITNNTIYDPDPVEPGPSWIQIDDHKTRGPSSNTIVRNNLAAAFRLGAGVMSDHNLEVPNPNLVYVNAAAGDFHLRPGSPAIDQGSAAAPATDLEGTARPQGAGVDIGAFEWVPPPPPAPDMGVPDEDMGVDPPAEDMMIDPPEADMMIDPPNPIVDQGTPPPAEDMSGAAPPSLPPVDAWRPPPATDMGPGDPTPDMETDPAADDGFATGCGCSTTSNNQGWAWMLLLLIPAVRRKRR